MNVLSRLPSTARRGILVGGAVLVLAAAAVGVAAAQQSPTPTPEPNAPAYCPDREQAGTRLGARSAGRLALSYRAPQSAALEGR
jgi:hypothetical protein